MSTTDHFELPVPTPGLDPMETVSEAIAKVRAALIAVDGILYAHATGIAGKAASDHVHEIAGITGLVDALAAKMAADATFTLAGLTDISGAVEAPGGYVLTKGGSGFQFMSASAALGTHGHLMSEVTGLTAALADVDTALDGKLELDGNNIAGNAGALRSSIKVAAAIEVKSAGYTAVAGDRGKMLVFSAAATLAFAPAATLGPDWPIYVRNESSGDVVLDPDGAEEVDGKTTVRVPPGYTCQVWCDGANFRTDLPRVRIRTAIVTAMNAFEVPLDENAINFALMIEGLVFSSNDTTLDGLVSSDGGATWETGTNFYNTGGHTVTNSNAFAGVIGVNGIRMGFYGNWAGDGWDHQLVLDISPGGASTRCMMSGTMYQIKAGIGSRPIHIATHRRDVGRKNAVQFSCGAGTMTCRWILEERH